MKLYHYQVYMPELQMPEGIIQLRYGHHAKQAANDDRYGTFKLPSVLDTTKAKVIEVEVDDYQDVTKVVYRIALDNARDLCIVMLSDGFVKTVWVNLKTDKHKTLKRWLYAQH